MLKKTLRKRGTNMRVNDDTGRFLPYLINHLLITWAAKSTLPMKECLQMYGVGRGSVGKVFTNRRNTDLCARRCARGSVCSGSMERKLRRFQTPQTSVQGVTARVHAYTAGSACGASTHTDETSKPELIKLTHSAVPAIIAEHTALRHHRTDTHCTMFWLDPHLNDSCVFISQPQRGTCGMCAIVHARAHMTVQHANHGNQNLYPL